VAVLNITRPRPFVHSQSLDTVRTGREQVDGQRNDQLHHGMDTPIMCLVER